MPEAVAKISTDRTVETMRFMVRHERRQLDGAEPYSTVENMASEWIQEMAKEKAIVDAKITLHGYWTAEARVEY